MMSAIRFKKSDGKIRHKQIEIDGFKFDSKLESERYLHLRLLEKAKIISNLKPHPKFELQEAYRDGDGIAQRAITYEADFSYEKGGDMVVEDVKSPFTAKDSVFRIKMKMFKKTYPIYKFYIVMFNKNKGGWFFAK